ncbi:MAG: GGDEF domain-containing protein [Burkholderiaceae bacterium]|nr:GGDEF domain-containing protein [Burkholderiaceae bacterium]
MNFGQSLLGLLKTSIFVFGVFFISSSAISEDVLSVDTLFRQVREQIDSSPSSALVTIQKLKERSLQFDDKQRDEFYLLSASALGMTGQQKARIELVLSYVKNVRDPNLISKFSYELSDAYVAIGEYENALVELNKSISVLERLTDVDSKVSTLQGAIRLANSLNGFDESLRFAERMLAIATAENRLAAKCYGLANIVEINFLMANSEGVQSKQKDAVAACDLSERKVISLFVKSIVAVDLINSGRNDDGIRAGLPLLYALIKSNGSSDYLVQLEEALARAYIRRNDLPNAERFGLRAFQRAKKENSVQMLERTSETMASLKRAQGQLNSAIDYYDINLALKKKVLDDQLQKNLAYQRVKFDSQDKANQLTLLEQKNKILTVEKQLQYGKNQNLVLLTTLITVLVAILGAWLMRTWRQKNLFRYSAQMDGLTQVSNRAHFIACCNLIFKRADQQVSLVLFDMDNFKKINDTFGHASGDWVLKNVCAAIQKTLRKNDVFGRLGGEEFGLCLVDLTDDEVLACAERWRAVVEEINTTDCGYQFSISASFGAASRGKHGLQSFEETLAAADKALYVSKNNGRNRVSVYE